MFLLYVIPVRLIFFVLYVFPVRLIIFPVYVIPVRLPRRRKKQIERT